MHLTSLFLASRGGGGSSFEAFDGYSIHVLQSSAVWSSAQV